jgi:hypothetical protein
MMWPRHASLLVLTASEGIDPLIRWDIDPASAAIVATWVSRTGTWHLLCLISSSQTFSFKGWVEREAFPQPGEDHSENNTIHRILSPIVGYCGWQQPVGSVHCTALGD